MQSQGAEGEQLHPYRPEEGEEGEAHRHTSTVLAATDGFPEETVAKGAGHLSAQSGWSGARGNRETVGAGVWPCWAQRTWRGNRDPAGAGKRWHRRSLVRRQAAAEEESGNWNPAAAGRVDRRLPGPACSLKDRAIHRHVTVMKIWWFVSLTLRHQWYTHGVWHEGYGPPRMGHCREQPV